MANLFDVYKTFRPRRTILSEDFNALQIALAASFARIGTAPPSGQTGVSSTFHCADPTEDQHAVTKGYFETVANPVFAPNIELARQWAEEDEDVLVDGQAGQYSAKHYSAKAEEKSQAWAETAENTDVLGVSGQRSALHWSARAEYWAGEAESVVTSGSASSAQGARADEAHGWGNHALAGYAAASSLSSYVLTSALSNYTPTSSLNILEWNEAYDWGDHSTENYAIAGTTVSFGQTTVTSLKIGSWTIAEVSGKLMFTDGANNRFSIDASGNVTADGNVTSEGTP